MTNTQTMNREEALSFARFSARIALDQRSGYASTEDALESHLENVRDTLNEYGATEFDEEARIAFNLEAKEEAARLGLTLEGGE